MSTVKIRRSGTASSTPSSLDHGELAINYADDTLFWKDSSNVIQSFVFQAYASTTHASTHATGGSDALSPADIGAAPAASPTFTGNATFDASSGVPLTITNTGTGNSFVVNDASGDATPFVIDGAGRTGIGVLDFAGLNAACDNLVVADAGGTVGATFLGTSLATIAFADGANSSDNLRGWVQYSHNDDSLRLGAGGGARVWVSANGNVGIATGATTPASLLHVNGVITVSAGTASAPALVASGDANTGAFFPAADTFAISTAGSERVRVKSTGAVRFVPLSADPASGEAGDVYYNSSTNKLRVYNGTSWVDLH